MASSDSPLLPPGEYTQYRLEVSSTWYIYLPEGVDLTVSGIIRAVPWAMPLEGQGSRFFRVRAVQDSTGVVVAADFEVQSDHPALVEARAHAALDGVRHQRLSGLSREQRDMVDEMGSRLVDLVIEVSQHPYPLPREISRQIREIANGLVRGCTGDNYPLPPRRVRDAYDVIDKIIDDFYRSVTDAAEAETADRAATVRRVVVHSQK